MRKARSAVLTHSLSTPPPRTPRRAHGRPHAEPGPLHECQVSEGGQLPGHGRQVVSLQVPGREVQSDTRQRTRRTLSPSQGAFPGLPDEAGSPVPALTAALSPSRHTLRLPVNVCLCDYSTNDVSSTGLLGSTTAGSGLKLPNVEPPQDCVQSSTQ